jgi:hypothetical protein
VLRIYIQRQDLRGSDGDAVEGTLTLVDLAGSEHRIDSMCVNSASLGYSTVEYYALIMQSL